MTDLAGYVLSIGTQPGTYTQEVPVEAPATSQTVQLPGGVTYYLAVAARDTSGNLSEKSAEISITLPADPAPTCPCSLWPANTVPVNAAANDTGAVELGVRFQSSVAGVITGIRFYKGAGNTDVHVGNLWSASGTKLGSVTFTGETPTGWQQAMFAKPIPIQAGVTYVASYYAPVGRYAADVQGLAQVRMNGPLSTLPSPNGVFRYAVGGGFPTEQWQSSNYFVDVIFASSAPLPTGATGLQVTIQR